MFSPFEWSKLIRKEELNSKYSDSISKNAIIFVALNTVLYIRYTTVRRLNTQPPVADRQTLSILPLPLCGLSLIKGLNLDPPLGGVPSSHVYQPGVANHNHTGRSHPKGGPLGNNTQPRLDSLRQ